MSEESIAHDEFSYDMAYLNGLADFMLETVGHHLPWPPQTTIFSRLKADISNVARRAVFLPWPETSMFAPWSTLQHQWDAA